jgi:uncharacterized membrane protein
MKKKAKVSLKKRIFTFIETISVLVPLFLLIVQPAAAQNLQNFTIDSFTSEYHLSRNSENVAQLKVKETISATFPAANQNHGIIRAIPLTYNKNDLQLKLGSVRNEHGEKLSFSESSSNGNKLLKIGDPDITVEGQHIYVIEYTMSNVVRSFDDHDEFYWDINGDQWQQPITSVDTTIYIDDPSIAASINDTKACYAGSYGEKDTACTIAIEKDGDEAVIKSAANNGLQSGQTLSIVVGFASGTFTEVKPNRLLQIAKMSPAVLFPLLTALWIFINWRKTGRDPKGRGVIVPQYTVPDAMNPVIASLVLHEEVQLKAISATLISLCIKGYLRMHEIEKKKLIGSKTQYELEIMKPLEGLSDEESKVAKMVFDADEVQSSLEGQRGAVGRRINLSTMDADSKLYLQVESLKTNADKAIVSRGYFVSDPQHAKKRVVYFGVFLLGLSFIALSLFSTLWPLTLGIGISGLLVLLFSRSAPKRTEKGVVMKEYLLGLKKYMELAEKDRIQFLQSPNGAEKVDSTDQTQIVKLYEKLLPYAMLFGIEEDWAKQFAHLYESQSATPNWYVGRNGFNAAGFAVATHSFGSATSGAFAAPTSSSSSGFSGGGYSGGGGGGGGGGGW